jgi:hypothetical protein
MGSELDVTFERELVGLTLRVNKAKVDEAIDLVS